MASKDCSSALTSLVLSRRSRKARSPRASTDIALAIDTYVWGCSVSPDEEVVACLTSTATPSAHSSETAEIMVGGASTERQQSQAYDVGTISIPDGGF
jgi:hypothetical protein